MGNLVGFDIKGHFNNIKKELCNLGYKNKVVDIKEAVNLYNQYGEGFDEKVFVIEVLDVTYEIYKKKKVTGGNIHILKDKDILTEGQINDLKQKLIEDGYAVNKIKLNEFNELFKKYGYGLRERTFATSVLGLSYGNYRKLKEVNDAVVIILKNCDNVEEIKNQMIKDGYQNYFIQGYEEFLSLYKKYGYCFTERYFSLNVLDITIDQYRHIKYNNARVRILMPTILNENLEYIKKELISKGYTNKMITYEELCILHKNYGSFTTLRNFAIKVLEMSDSSYVNLKYGKNLNVTIFPYKEITLEQIKNIKKELIEQGYEGKLISKEEIDELYKNYSSIMTRSRFIQDVLGVYKINTNNYSVTVLPKKDVFNDEQINKLKQIISDNGYYYKKVSPDFAYKLYEEYGKDLTFNAFVNRILGITAKQLSDAKYYNRSVMIIDIDVKNKMDFITKNYLTNVRYYSKDEITEICSNYNIGLEDFIYYTMLSTVNYKHNIYIQYYLNILNSKQQLWIGDSAISHETIAKYYSKITVKIKRIVSTVKSLHPYFYETVYDEEDDFQNLLLFFLENGAEIEKNFMVYEDPLWEKYFSGKLRRKLFNIIMQRYNFQECQMFFKKKDGQYEEKDFASCLNTEESAIINIQGNSSDCVCELSYFLKHGYEIKEAKILVCNKYNISELELYNNMKEHIKNNGIEDFDLSVLGIAEEFDNSGKRLKLK